MFKDRERDYVPRPDQTGVFCREGRRAQDRSWAITFLIVCVTTVVIGAANTGIYLERMKTAPTASDMEFGKACDGALFQTKLEANNERAKMIAGGIVEQAIENVQDDSGRRRKLFSASSKRSSSLGPDGPDYVRRRQDPKLGTAAVAADESAKKQFKAKSRLGSKELFFNSNQPFDVMKVVNAALWCAGISLIVSVFMGVFIVYMFRTCAHKTVWGIIYFKIGSLFGMSLMMLGMGSMEGFITFLLIGLLTWFVYWIWTDELNVVAQLLAVSSQCLQDNPGILKTVLSLQVLVLVFVIPVVAFIYIAMLGGAPDVNPMAIYQNQSTKACADYVGRPVNCCASTQGAWVSYYLALSFIAMIWAFAFALEARMYVIGGTVCQWYFAPKGSKNFSGFAWTSTKHAFGPSFGTVSFGSAIMTAVEMMRQSMEKARQENEQNIILCMVQSCLECIWQFIEYLSKFAMLQASMTGEAFCDAASNIFDLLTRNFLLAYGTYAFPSMILQIMSFIFALVAAAGAYGITWTMFEMEEEIMSEGYAAICALVTGIVVWCSLSYFTMILVNTTDAVFVCYAKDKDRNEIHHEEMHAVFENAVNRRREANGEIVRNPQGPYAYGAGNTVNKQY